MACTEQHTLIMNCHGVREEFRFNCLPSTAEIHDECISAFDMLDEDGKTVEVWWNLQDINGNEISSGSVPVMCVGA